MKKIIDNRLNVTIGFIIFTLALLAIMFPVLHDDLIHGTVKVGFTFMPHVNGRYLGNFFSIVLANSLLFRICIKTITTSLLIFLITKIINVKNKIYYLIITSLFLFMPKEMFRETMVFSAGFANYVIPIVSILYIIRSYLNNTFIKAKNCLIVPLLLLGVINSLFMEHVTIFNLILSGYLVIYYYIKTKKINQLYLVYFIGSLSGTILMFTNPVYLRSFAGEDGYRSISTIGSMIYKFGSVVHGALFDNYIINIILIILISLLYKNIFTKKDSTLSKIIIIYLWVFGIYILFKMYNPNWLILSRYTKPFEALITIFFASSILYLIFKSALLKKKELNRLLFYIACYVIVLAPLVIVNPVGPRCFIIAYVFLILFVINLFEILTNNKIINLKLIEKTVILFIYVQCFFYLSIYGLIHYKNITIISEVIQQRDNGNEIINVQTLPYTDYLHVPGLCSEYNVTVFKEYYKINPDVIINYACDTSKNN